jgi:hypothetical protein
MGLMRWMPNARPSWLASVPRPAPSQTRPWRPGSLGAIWASEARANPISSLGQWSKSSGTRSCGSGLRPITKQVFRPRTCLPRLVGRSGLVACTDLVPRGSSFPPTMYQAASGSARRGLTSAGSPVYPGLAWHVLGERLYHLAVAVDELGPVGVGERTRAVGVEQADLQGGGDGGVTKAGSHLLPGFFADQALGVLPVVAIWLTACSTSTVTGAPGSSSRASPGSAAGSSGPQRGSPTRQVTAALIIMWRLDIAPPGGETLTTSQYAVHIYERFGLPSP